MDWNLKGYQPLNTSAIVLPAGANTGVTVSQEPESKETILIQAIQGASASIWAEMYTFTDNDVANELALAASKGIDVQVLYEPRLSQQALLNLSPDQQQLPKWAFANGAVLPNNRPVNTRHAKFMIIDNNQAYIMTTNFTRQALGGDMTASVTNREYIVFDTNSQDVQTLAQIFQQDKQGQSLLPLNAPNLIVSSINAHSLLWKLLDSASQTIFIQTEEINDPVAGGALAQSWSIEGELIKVANRGVQVQVMMPLKGIGGPNAIDNTGVIQRLNGIPNLQIKTGSQYYMHAKLIIIDQSLAFVGSQNLSRAALDYNREVGILISSAGEVQKLCQTFTTDWAQAPN